MWDKYDQELGQKIMELLGEEYPTAMPLDTLKDEFSEYDEEVVRQTVRELTSRKMNEDGLTQTAEWDYRLAPSPESELVDL